MFRRILEDAPKHLLPAVAGGRRRFEFKTLFCFVTESSPVGAFEVDERESRARRRSAVEEGYGNRNMVRAEPRGRSPRDRRCEVGGNKGNVRGRQ